MVVVRSHENRRATMLFTDAEFEYLNTQLLGRLATVQSNGTLQVSPVSYRYNERTGTIDIRGRYMSRSQKFKNVAANGRVAFVVDDLPSTQPWRVRCLEIRGRGEALTAPTDSAFEPDPNVDGAIIRIHPEKIIGFGIDDPDRDPHELEKNIRRVPAV